MKWIWKCLFCLVLFTFLLQASEVVAQSEPWPPYPQFDVDDPHTIDRGPGGYFAWWKLLLIGLVFVVWIKLADWINKDAIKYQSQHELAPEIWNSINVVAFLLGLFGAVVNIPIFLLGFPVYLLTAFGPFGVYLLMRRGKVDVNKVEKKTGEGEESETDDEPILSKIIIKAAGENPDHQQSNLIRARQSPTYIQTAQMLYDVVYRRGEVLIMDYTKERVNRKVQIDGAWIEMPPLDRPTGDAMLISLKYLANLNPADRRTRQIGRFPTKIRRLEVLNHLTTLGVPTGERVVLKFETQQKQPLELARLGMWTDEYEKFREALNEQGYIVISAPAGQGLTTTWRGVLHSADRFISDWVGILDHDEIESEMENIEPNRFNSEDGGSPADILPSLLLKQPKGLVVPSPVNAKSLDIITREVVDFDRTAISRLHAKSAIEAALRLLTLSDDHRERYVKALSVVTCQRLVRRLCDQCKQPMQVTAQLIKQLGGDPQNPPSVYTHYRLPPPEQRVDEKGKPLEFPPCETCGGIGYIGRVAVFELLYLNKAIREAMIKEPKVESVGKVAREQGHLSLPQQGYRLVLEGITSIEEVQRVMKS